MISKKNRDRIAFAFFLPLITMSSFASDSDDEVSHYQGGTRGYPSEGYSFKVPYDRQEDRGEDRYYSSSRLSSHPRLATSRDVERYICGGCGKVHPEKFQRVFDRAYEAEQSLDKERKKSHALSAALRKRAPSKKDQSDLLLMLLERQLAERDVALTQRDVALAYATKFKSELDTVDKLRKTEAEIVASTDLTTPLKSSTKKEGKLEQVPPGVNSTSSTSSTHMSSPVTRKKRQALPDSLISDTRVSFPVEKDTGIAIGVSTDPTTPSKDSVTKGEKLEHALSDVSPAPSTLATHVLSPVAKETVNSCDKEETLTSMMSKIYIPEFEEERFRENSLTLEEQEFVETTKAKKIQFVQNAALQQLKEGNFFVAKELYEEALRRNKGSTSIRADYAMTLLNINDSSYWREGAEKLYDEAVKNNGDVLEFLSSLNKEIKKNIKTNKTKAIELIVEERTKKEESDPWLLRED